ncbi:MAG: Crp/Fnr family transcriptional regulator [Alkalinema sp. CAN_BIN05]|nr:Crp/Fnr family transcriptional regulator [Alkalinema sp. CAN_BIN05]
MKSFRRGQVIPLYEQDIWLVYRGVVQLSTLYPSGDEAILGLISPLMPFGEQLSLMQPYSAVALSNVDLMRLNWQEVLQSPEMMQCMFGQMKRRLQQSESLLAIASYRRVEDRLVEFLALLKRETSLPITLNGKSLNRITIRLTHQHFANAIGTTRVTITRLLGQLRDRGILDFDDTRHIILP